MALSTTILQMRNLLGQISADLVKSEKGNKAASQRVRTGTVRLEKVAKTYRKESIKSEKATKGQKKPAKKATTSAKKPAVKHHAKATVKAKAKPKTAKTHARARSFSVKRPTAKLPAKRR